MVSTAICKILVTGGSGLVGSAIKEATLSCHALFGRDENEEWVFVASSHGDLRNYEAARSLFEIHKPTKVVHLAARVGGAYENSLKPASFLLDNLAIDGNISRLCHEFKVQKLVFCLSTCIFPDKTSYPINKSMLHDGPPHDSNFGYAYAKQMLDCSNRAYLNQHGCNYTAVIPTNIYGPNDNFSKGCHFVPAIIQRIAQARDAGADSIIIPGSGSALRQFISSHDLAKLIIWVLKNYNTPTPIILSVDESDEIMIKEVVQQVCKLSGFQGTVEWDTSQTDGQLKKTADNSRMKEHIGEFSFTPLEIGLAETLAWYDGNRHLVRDGLTKSEIRGHRKGE
ncbi:putative GDP-L-fucose synthetase [Tothia fuscella]|uniref:GDP-L-fucose synthase n=1 Tax=Tothia fuscella TaxID=1048955 RepID=A0A9P4NRA6_9PEZI|nr:putative GDP-L-fucose synthetase [Tothia fuscella]